MSSNAQNNYGMIKRTKKVFIKLYRLSSAEKSNFNALIYCTELIDSNCQNFLWIKVKIAQRPLKKSRGRKIRKYIHFYQVPTYTGGGNQGHGKGNK